MRTVSFEGYMMACAPFPPSSHETIQNMSEWRIQLFLVLAQKLIRWSAINESSALKISAQKQQVLFWWPSARISFRRMAWQKLFLHHFFTVYLSCRFQGLYFYYTNKNLPAPWQITRLKNLILYILSGDLAEILRALPALNIIATQAAVEVAARGGRCRLDLELVPSALSFPGSSNAKKYREGIYDLNSEQIRTSARMGKGKTSVLRLLRLCLKKRCEENE